ncbi:unnamed protein product [Prorocentrum cordatum]|uniref:Uncharacterized protein n=1 Tax=Prorocentrum cordatum TaxID=2364126 RepID=A0ABN9USR4_9DINO|nr:unnamed protein product [Polarella glacialis]
MESLYRTNARMDRDQFERAEQEFRRVGGEGNLPLSDLAAQAGARAAVAAERATRRRAQRDDGGPADAKRPRQARGDPSGVSQDSGARGSASIDASDRSARGQSDHAATSERAHGERTRSG